MEVMNSGWTESELCVLYRDARNKKEQIQIIAELLGMTSTNLVIEILERGGCIVLDDKKKEEILKEYYNNALSDSAIAKKTGIAQSQVSTFLRKKGLPPNGKICNKKEDKVVPGDIKKALSEVKQEPIKTVQPEIKQTEVIENLKKETLKNYEELKEVLPKSIPDHEDLPINYEVIESDVIETLTPQQYYELAKMTIQSINSMIETLRTVWEG